MNTNRHPDVQPIEPGSGAGKRYTTADMRQQIHRMGQILMRLNERYLKREAELHALYAENPNRSMLMDTDKVLRDASGGAKTIATILTGLASVLQAEEAYQATLERRKPTFPPEIIGRGGALARGDLG